MLITAPRIALLQLCIAGMEAAWLTPLFLLLYPGAVPPPALYLALFAALVAWMLALDLMSRAGVASPAYELLTIGLMFATGLAAVRLLLFPGGPAGDPGWLRQAWVGSMTFTGGFPAAATILLTNFVLWQRGTSATGRNLDFFHVGANFRVGMLILIAGGALASALRGEKLVWLLFVYFALGLTAVSVARIHEKAAGSDSAGRPLPPARLAQLLLAVGAAILAAALAVALFTPPNIGRVAGFFDPLVRALAPLVLALLALLGRLLSPLLVWIEEVVTGALRRRGDIPVTGEPGPAITGAPAEQASGFPGWLATAIEIAVIAGIVLAALAALGFLVLYLDRTRRARLRSGAEISGTEAPTFGGGLLARAGASLSGLAGLVGRFGLGRDLLAAVSVENLYANLCRMARARGFPRAPSQPPDAYLPVLALAFEGQKERLARITAAYMRVHYGDHPVSPEELASLRADYRVLAESAGR